MAIFPAALPPDLEFLHLSPLSKGDAALFAAGGRGPPLDLPLMRFARGRKGVQSAVQQQTFPAALPPNV